MSRRADRLFRLVSEMRGRRLAVTAGQLASALEVSPRTIYRDIRDLTSSGVPIAGEAGVGYVLDPGFELPPVMFTRDETLALLLGLQMTQAFTDPALGAAAGAAAVKIRAILDDQALEMLERQPYRIPACFADNTQRARHQVIRQATEQRCKLRIDYVDRLGAASRRIVWPLGLIGWSQRWTLLAWCERREDYRNFRFDRIDTLEALTETYPVRQDRSLADYLKQVPQLN
ncbi:MAG: YafY family protein [Pseudomonadota bacterium]